MRQLISLLRVAARAGAIVCALLAMRPAAAAVIGFDNLLGGGVETAPIDGTYSGFNWTNFTVLDTVLYTADLGANGYANGVVSQRNVAYAGYGGPAGFSAVQSFLLFSYAIGAAWDDGLTIMVQGWHAGILVGTDVFTVSTQGSIRRTPAWANIDTVTFTASGGTDAGYRGMGPEYYLDDIHIGASVILQDEAIPEPSGVWLFLAAIGAFMLLRLGIFRTAYGPEEHW